MEDEAVYGTTALEKMLTVEKKTVEIVIGINPMGAVRTTGKQMFKDERYKRYNDWKKSFYWLILDAARKEGYGVRDLNWYSGIELIEFGIEIPEGSSKAKKEEFRGRIGKAHEMKPDIDNMLKAVLDAVLEEDCKVNDIGRVRKVWSEEGYIRIVFRL